MKKGEKAGQEGRPKAHTRDSLQALSKLAEQVDGSYRIVSQPPIVVPLRDLHGRIGMSEDELEHAIHEQFRAYRATLQDDRRQLLERFEVIDMARKVVGVGSVGTRAFIVLLQGRDQQDPLFLQVKEATASVLEDHLPKSRYKQPGERVVQGPADDAGGERHLPGLDEGRRGEPLPVLAPAPRHEGLGRRGGDEAARARRSTPAQCGWTLARAHARSGDPIAIAAYLGKSDGSTGRSPTSPSATPIRTSRTTRRSRRPSGPAAGSDRGRLNWVPHTGDNGARLRGGRVQAVQDWLSGDTGLGRLGLKWFRAGWDAISGAPPGRSP